MKVEKASRDGSECENLFKKALRGFIMVGEYFYKKSEFCVFFAVQRAPIKPGIGNTSGT